MTGEVLEVVEDGNRLIQFLYDGIFEEILDQLGQMPLPPYITHQLRIRTVIRQYMPNMMVLPLPQQRDFILHRNYYSRFVIWA